MAVKALLWPWSALPHPFVAASGLENGGTGSALERALKKYDATMLLLAGRLTGRWLQYP